MEDSRASTGAQSPLVAALPNQAKLNSPRRPTSTLLQHRWHSLRPNRRGTPVRAGSRRLYRGPARCLCEDCPHRSATPRRNRCCGFCGLTRDFWRMRGISLASCHFRFCRIGDKRTDSTRQVFSRRSCHVSGVPYAQRSIRGARARSMDEGRSGVFSTRHHGVCLGGPGSRNRRAPRLDGRRLLILPRKWAPGDRRSPEASNEAVQPFASGRSGDPRLSPIAGFAFGRK